jgi:hypothetical protein
MRKFTIVIVTVLFAAVGVPKDAQVTSHRVSESAAVRKVRELPEVREFGRWLKKATNGKVGVIAFSEGDSDARMRGWRVYVGEDHDDHTSEWNRFLVNANDGLIYVLDSGTDQWIPLKTWRQRQHPTTREKSMGSEIKGIKGAGSHFR